MPPANAAVLQTFLEIWCDEADGLGGSPDDFSYERLLLPIAKPLPPAQGRRPPPGTLKRRS